MSSLEEKLANATELCRMAYWHGTNKTPLLYVGYTPYYHEQLKDKRAFAKKILEIGIYRGSSLLLWREYFPNAQIYGLDIDPNRLINEPWLDRIKCLQCDQGNYDSLKSAAAWVGGDIDFICDDASHIPSQQIMTAQAFAPLLAKDGFYAIEDIEDPSIMERLPLPSRLINFDLSVAHYNRLIVMGGRE